MLLTIGRPREDGRTARSQFESSHDCRALKLGRSALDLKSAEPSYRINRSVVICCVLLASCGPLVANGQTLPEVKALVQDFSDRFRQACKNLKCSVDGVDARGVHYRGELALLGDPTHPSTSSRNWGFSITRMPGFKSASGSADEEARVGNLQYSFRVARPDRTTPYHTDGVHMQLEDPKRGDLRKDPVYFSFLTTDGAAIFAPIRVFDIDAADLFDAKDGIKIANFAATIGEDGNNHFNVEFRFPPDHPYFHDWARVTFGNRGEVEGYELRERKESGAVVTYAVNVTYSSATTLGEIPFASGWGYRAVRMSNSGNESTVVDGVWQKLHDYRIGENAISGFSLTHYGIPEPPGTNILRKSPVWLIGTCAGAVFIALGVYFARRAR